MRQQLESSLQKLPDSAEKRAYSASVDHYLTVTQQRNQVVLSIDGINRRLAQIGTDRKAAQAQLSTVGGKLNQAVLSASDVTDAIQAAQNILDQLVRLTNFQMLQYSRALDFWTLDSQVGPSAQTQFANLGGNLSFLNNRLVDALSDAGNPPGQLTDSPIKIVLSSDQISRAVETGIVSFRVSTDDDQRFRSRSQTLVDKIQIDFWHHGLFGSKRITPMKMNVVHSGYHHFIRRDGTSIAFVTPARTIRLEYDAHNQIVTQTFSETASSVNPSDTAAIQGNNSASYVGVSPFTTWTVHVDEQFRKSLESAKEIHLYLFGTVRAVDA